MILLISESPVAGTIARLAKWIKILSDIECYALIRKNYPNNSFELPNGGFGHLSNWESYLSRYIYKANLIIIHNISDEDLLGLIFTMKRAETPLIYQFHSPPNEPPLYDYEILLNNKFDAIFSVAQGHGRFIDSSILVPNIITDFNDPLSAIEKSNTIFLPHMRSTNYKWSNKLSDKDSDFLSRNEILFNGFRIKNIPQIFGRSAVTHQEFLLFLQSASIIIDDINTGLFHQTALEGLKAGCIVASSADLESIDEFCSTNKAPPPPFLQAFGSADLVKKLILQTSSSKLKNAMEISRNYGRNYLGEARLANIYFNILKKYL